MNRVQKKTKNRETLLNTQTICNWDLPSKQEIQTQVKKLVSPGMYLRINKIQTVKTYHNWAMNLDKSRTHNQLPAKLADKTDNAVS